MADGSVVSDKTARPAVLAVEDITKTHQSNVGEVVAADTFVT